MARGKTDGRARVDDLLQVILLGVIEGVTEFLPISSTGHLLIAERLGLGARSELFNIGIQAGAILAVTVIFWRRVVGLATGLRQVEARGDAREQDNAEQRAYAAKLAVAFGVTALLGLIVKKLGFELPERIAPVAWALVLGGLFIEGAERYAARRPASAEVSWRTAVVVGLAQILAGVFPGTSRSGATIFAAMFAGTSDRKAATEFSFLLGIPTMYAASGYALLKELRRGDGHEDWLALGVATLVSTLTAFVVVKWLLRYIQSHSFRAFAIYRVALGLALLLLVPSRA
jgi:undecaprenyl-diphosphatase